MNNRYHSNELTIIFFVACGCLAMVIAIIAIVIGMSMALDIHNKRIGRQESVACSQEINKVDQ